MPQEGLAALKLDRSRYRAGRRVWPWVVAGVVAIVLASAGPALLSGLRAPEVFVAPVVRLGTVDGRAVDLAAAGYVVADRQSVLASKITGRLEKLLVQEAQPVTKGQLVAEIAHQDIDAQIAQTKAEHAEAIVEIERLRKLVAQQEAQFAAAQAPVQTTDAQLVELAIKLADAKRKLERDKKVAQQDALAFSIVEDREFEVRAAEAQIQTMKLRRLELERAAAVAEAQLGVARTAITVAEAHVASMASRIKALEAQVVDAYVYAPFDGIVTEKAAEIGEIVAPISIGGSMARGSIVTIADWHSLQAEVDVAEAYIARVQAGGRAAITADAFPDKSFAGKVRRILPRADRSKATVKVRVDFVNEPNGVLPDMGVRVKFLAPDAPAGAEAEGAREKNGVPQAAVLGAPESPYVWTVADGLARKQSVQTGATRDGMTEIKSGLVPGQKVVTRGAENLVQDGQKVRVGE